MITLDVMLWYRHVDYLHFNCRDLKNMSSHGLDLLCNKVILLNEEQPSTCFMTKKSLIASLNILSGILKED